MRRPVLEVGQAVFLLVVGCALAVTAVVVEWLWPR